MRGRGVYVLLMLCMCSAGCTWSYISFGVTAILARTISSGYVSIAAVVPARDPANNLGNGGSTLIRKGNARHKVSFPLWNNNHCHTTRWSEGCQVNGHILALQAVVFSQQLLVLLMGAELDGSIWDDSNHGGRVSPPQAEEAILQVSPVDQSVGLLRRRRRRRWSCLQWWWSESWLAFRAFLRLCQHSWVQMKSFTFWQPSKCWKDGNKSFQTGWRIVWSSLP